MFGQKVCWRNKLLNDVNRLLVWAAADRHFFNTTSFHLLACIQIPQWCVQFAKESEFQFGTVVCIQPCHLAAMSLAIQVGCSFVYWCIDFDYLVDMFNILFNGRHQQKQSTFMKQQLIEFIKQQITKSHNNFWNCVTQNRKSTTSTKSR